MIETLKFFLAVILGIIGIYISARLISYAASRSYFKVKSDFEKGKELENGKKKEGQ